MIPELVQFLKNRHDIDALLQQSKTWFKEEGRHFVVISSERDQMFCMTRELALKLTRGDTNCELIKLLDTYNTDITCVVYGNESNRFQTLVMFDPATEKEKDITKITEKLKSESNWTKRIQNPFRH